MAVVREVHNIADVLEKECIAAVAVLKLAESFGIEMVFEIPVRLMVVGRSFEQAACE